jgi:hypothetical protein
MKAPNVTEGDWLAAHNSSWYKDVNVIARQEKAGLHHVSVAFVSSLSEPDAKMLAASKNLAEALNAIYDYGDALTKKRPVWVAAKEALLQAGYVDTDSNT